jgi:hypothetical protein
MHYFSHINLLQIFYHFGLANMTAIMVGCLSFASPSEGTAATPAKTVAAADDDDSDDWMFDKSTYTHNKTGKRVDQYRKEKTPYRDPNAWFDSPTGDFLFAGNSWNGGCYGFEPFLYYAMLPEYYSKLYFGEDGSGYYPYDGDPNDEEIK